MKKRPPYFAKSLLQLFRSRSEHESLIGDFEEIYDARRNENGIFSAYLWYWFQVLRSLPSFLSNSIIWSIVMYANYLKVALRTMRKNKLSSFTNIFGLTVGMACCIFILLWMQDELSYDRFHKNSNSIHRVVAEMKDGFKFTATPGLLGPALLRDFPELVNATRIKTTRSVLVKVEEKSNYESGLFYVDPSFLKMFSFGLLIGNSEEVLSEPGYIVITESYAKKYFGENDPIGKTLQINNDKIFTVSGIVKDIPKNSTLDFQFLVPFSYYETIDKYIGDLGRFDFETYIQVEEYISKDDFEAKLVDYMPKFNSNSKAKLHLQPLIKLHLYDLEGMGRIMYIYLFAVIALIILFNSCINFVNLTIAQAGKRAKEIGVRKVIGAARKELIKQQFGETFLLTFIAFVLTLISVIVILPSFNAIVDKQLVLELNAMTFAGIAGVALATGFFSGIYPAFFLSAYQPVKILKGTGMEAGSRKSYLRKPLILFQNLIAAILIISTLVVFKQLNFIQNRNLGFDKSTIVYISMNSSTKEHYSSIKRELSQNSDIIGVTASEALPTYMANWSQVSKWEGKTTEGFVKTNSCSIDRNFIEIMDMELIQGTDQADDMSGEEQVFIVNEELVRQMQIESPINKRINLWGKYNSKIIGIVKNFHFRPLTQEIEPLILRFTPGTSDINAGSFRYISIKLNTADINRTLANIEKTVTNFAPEFPFSYGFLDERIEAMYKSENRVGTIFSYFALLAITISCMGLFGLVSFKAEQRTKEIAIRKVMGASISEIAVLITKEFMQIIALANVIAWPIAYFYLNIWLQNFAYRVEIGAEFFLTAGILTAFISLLTISYQVFRAAASNPANSLRSD